MVLKDIFMFYPYKVNFDTSDGTIPSPYIKREDIVENEFSLNFKQWSNVVERYLELSAEVLLSGNKLELPLRMGHLQIRKIKMNKFLDKKQSREQHKKVYVVKPNPDGYYLKLFWDKNYKICFLKFKWHWKITFNRKLIREAYRRCENDFTYINKFLEK